MTTHELSNLLADIVLLLRRMPDVPVSDFFAVPPTIEEAQPQPQTTIAEKVRRPPKSRTTGTQAAQEGSLPDWTTTE
jgi:hypothetical protein